MAEEGEEALLEGDGVDEDPYVGEEEALAEDEGLAEEAFADEVEEPILDDGALAEEDDGVAAEEDDGVAAEEEAVMDELDISDHLREAVEGSLRLKRYLTQDEEDEKGQVVKRARVSTPELEKAKGLVTKWGIPNDAVCLHILEQLPVEDLEQIERSNYRPDVTNLWKSGSEQLHKYVCEVRERKLPSGGHLDVVAAFRARWKLDMAQDKALRALSHKDLRFVIDHHDGAAPLDDVIQDAASHAPEDEEVTENAVPDRPGLHTMSRFSRMELIDPLADAAVFGDANLTFSLRLARHRKALGHVGRVIATTFEELDTLRERYKEIDESIKTLEEHYAEVYHGVDCTRIALDRQFEGLENSLGAVYYNFPHSGAIQGFFDGHPIVNWRHENLMRLFFRALRSFVKPGGVVKVSSNMGAVGVRYSYIIGSAIENEFMHTETMRFLDWHLHRYGRSYGDKRDVYKRPDAKKNESYNSQRAEADMVYCFRFMPSGEQLPRQAIRLPPTLSTLMACTDGPFKMLQGEMKKNLAKSLHKRFVTEVSGVHVG